MRLVETEYLNSAIVSYTVCRLFASGYPYGRGSESSHEQVHTLPHWAWPHHGTITDHSTCSSSEKHFHEIQKIRVLKSVESVTSTFHGMCELFKQSWNQWLNVSRSTTTRPFLMRSTYKINSQFATQILEDDTLHGMNTTQMILVDFITSGKWIKVLFLLKLLKRFFHAQTENHRSWYCSY